MKAWALDARLPLMAARGACVYPLVRERMLTSWIVSAPFGSNAALETSAPALVTAAETFLRTHAAETVEGVVAQRALGHYWESLRQYLAIRLGDAGAKEALRAMVSESRDIGSLLAPPGPRARLFRAARTHAMHAEGTPSELRWWEPAEPMRAARLRMLRARLDTEARELLELRYTRALSLDELAFVIDRPLEEARRAFDAAHARAEKVLRASGVARRELEDHLLEAFALSRAGRGRSSSPYLSVGEVVGNRYEIESHLGSGAFADVYRARDREVPDHVVALKMRRVPSDHDDSRSAARRELQLIASVFHPSVVQLKDHGWHDGRLWFVMPYYRGETLAARLRKGPLSRAEARTIFEPLANALAAMHRSGVRHQDIKPENIFLAELDPGETGEATILPVLLDLGVAVRDAEAVLAGTPLYFAPEVAARFGGIPDPPALSDRSDVFALALALRNALEPQTAEDIVGGSVDAFIARRARRAPAPPSSSSLRFLRPSFERWLSLRPDERPTAEELARELRILTQPEERRARRSAVLRWVVPVVIAFVALGSAGFWIASRETELSRLEAERARQQAHAQRLLALAAQARAANIREDLTAEARARQALQEEVERLELEYQSSRLTRDELVMALARTEGELSMQEQRFAEASRQAARDIAALEAERDALQEELAAQAELLAQARSRAAALAAAEEERRQREEEAEQARREAEARIAQLELQLEALRPARVPKSPFEEPSSDENESPSEPESKPEEAPSSE